MLLGVYNIAGLSIDIGKMLLLVFIVLSILSFLANFIRGRKSNHVIGVILATAGFGLTNLHADDNVSKKSKEVINDTRRAAKNIVREVKDQACELRDGKMDCALQKAKHTIEKGADHVEDAID